MVCSVPYARKYIDEEGSMTSADGHPPHAFVEASYRARTGLLVVLDHERSHATITERQLSLHQSRQDQLNAAYALSACAHTPQRAR